MLRKEQNDLVTRAGPGSPMSRHGLAKGAVPPGVIPAHHRLRSASVAPPPDQAVKDAARAAARPAVAHAAV